MLLEDRDVRRGDVQADDVDLDAEDTDCADAQAEEVIFCISQRDCCGKRGSAATRR